MIIGLDGSCGGRSVRLDEVLPLCRPVWGRWLPLRCHCLSLVASGESVRNVDVWVGQNIIGLGRDAGVLFVCEGQHNALPTWPLVRPNTLPSFTRPPRPALLRRSVCSTTRSDRRTLSLTQRDRCTLTKTPADPISDRTSTGRNQSCSSPAPSREYDCTTTSVCSACRSPAPTHSP